MDFGGGLSNRRDGLEIVTVVILDVSVVLRTYKSKGGLAAVG